MTALELREATKRFTDAHICASLGVESGRQLVLLGPSGSGKSTVLRMIAGLTEPDAGDVCFDGRSMAGVRPEHRSAAMVFQDHALFPFRTVAENVAYGLRIQKVRGDESAERTAQALGSVHLTGFEDRWPADLSGGERQRVALARALVVQPRVLLLDEPFSSLDPVLRTELQQLLSELQRASGVTSVFVTHDRAEAMAVADVVAVLLDGHVREMGLPEAVLHYPTDSGVAAFVDAPLKATDAS